MGVRIPPPLPELSVPTESGRGRRQRFSLLGEIERGTMATQAVKVKNGESQGGMGSELGGKVTGTISNMREFLHDVRVEMKQVTWPSREDVVATTWIVVATVAFFGVFLWLVDMGVQRGVQYIFKKFGV
ncbi:MAG: preprotein translocase subunit SecE [Acidobacteria bacterium]|nr:MAG: preprotein translocase subunit SecE [Acidobacteriota bacterium]